ncbi:glycine C-acetyltransferase/8-amino-7-oxononanoate synthase [Geothermobacter ehrlichii]|uniref:8-amino-7-ketopelargonate synthase n=1 Tax=Geothermobacter ehrlichii TaxID=213224 RepID=A0A5D3WIQ4_9BACT|nr:8-amino-7-oxononanoate synthase [Geothermobacter ehrlichii]TYO98759.1 glycine C-acetyltransferase/8-amino-7-oxononanoate synthase [Geothermobacter ehrlichii]
MEDWQKELDRLSETGMRRFLRVIDGAQGPQVELDGRRVLLLCSNNYLGLAGHPALIEAMVRATRDFGAGSGASRLVSGTMRAHVELEERLAAFKGTEAALLFNSGFAANTGILQALFGPDDLIFSDELNHASIIDGCRLSTARVRVYPHADVQALEAIMRQEAPKRRGRWLIVTDGVFSMDGDLAPLRELAALKRRFDALLMVDDAHGTGVLGATGRGTAEELGCLQEVDLHMGTLGKALGVCGAYLAASRTVIDLLVNRCRPFIYSTSLPPGAAAAAQAALAIVEGDEGRRLRRDLQRKTALFTAILRAAGCDLLASSTQIVPVITRQPDATMRASRRLLEEGYFVQGIRPPTVPEGLCRLRATLMASHADADVENAARAIVRVVGDGDDG